MLGIYVAVPIACFRKGLAREFLETERIPPPANCYGFLLSLVGETNRRRHIGSRISPTLLGKPEQSVVLRTVWRCKDKNYWIDPTGRQHLVSTTKKERDAFVSWVKKQGWPEPEFLIGLGAGTNARPDYQQLLSGIELVIWLDSSEESGGEPKLEDRVRQALDPKRRGTISRFGGLSLGESTHLVDVVKQFTPDESRKGEVYLLAPRGRLTLPVWVDHVGSAGTRYVTGDLVFCSLSQPDVGNMPLIEPRSTPMI